MHPKTYAARALAAAAICLATTGLVAAPALAAETQRAPEGSAVRVKLAGIDLSTAEGLARLDARLDRAARQACEVYNGSALDKGPEVQACLTAARTGALQQLARLGYDVPAQLSGGGGSR